MRWYQQSRQGTNPATSENHKLPNVAVAATAAASHSAAGRMRRGQETTSSRHGRREP